MNYITEINNFYDWLETNPVSDSAIVLWHALMHINNKCGWKREFSVSITTLQIKTGLSKSSILRARNTLNSEGRINFMSRGGQQSAIYSIIACHTDTQSEAQTQGLADFAIHTDAQSGEITDNSEKFVVHTDTQTVTLNPVVVQCDTQSEAQNLIARHTDTQTVTINKLNNNINNNKEASPFFSVAGEIIQGNPSERILEQHTMATDSFMLTIFRGMDKAKILEQLDHEYVGYQFRDEMHLRNSFKSVGEKMKNEAKPRPGFQRTTTTTPAPTTAGGFVIGQKRKGVNHEK